jgi:hypothetical protein
VTFLREEFMDTVSKQFIWLNDDIDPSLGQKLTGKFQAKTTWATCELELYLTKNGVLKGHFTVGEQALEVKGGIGKTGMAYGFLLEPIDSVPVALFRIKTNEHGLQLELDVPEFDELLEHCSLEGIALSRVETTHTPST